MKVYLAMYLALEAAQQEGVFSLLLLSETVRALSFDDQIIRTSNLIHLAFLFFLLLRTSRLLKSRLSFLPTTHRPPSLFIIPHPQPTFSPLKPSYTVKCEGRDSPTDGQVRENSRYSKYPLRPPYDLLISLLRLAHFHRSD